MARQLLGDPGPVRRRRLKLLPLLVCIGALLLSVAGQAGAFDPNPGDPDLGTYSITVDENGANDVPGQKDLTLHGIDESGLPTTFRVLWDWDETSISGGNTLDACVLLDSDGDIFANLALCETLGNQPLAELATTLYSCGDTRVDRCSSQIAVVPLPANSATSCEFAVTNNTDPFTGNGKSGGADKPRDTRAKCTLNLPEIAAATNTTVADLNLINTCSYPSQQPNSDPSDCVLIPRDATLVIAKNAGGDTTTTFGFTVSGGGTFSGNIGEGTPLASRTIGIVSGVNTVVAESSVPTNWEFVSGSCAGSTLSGGNGSPGQSITVKAATGNTITCTFTNALKAPPQLTIEKSCPSGKHDPADRFQPTNGGSNVGSALDCAGSTTITLEPNTGYDIGEVAAGTTVLANYTVDTDSDTDCANANGLPRGAATPTCTITNTLKAKPQLTIEKVCPSGKHDPADRFQPTNGGSNVGSALDCDGSTTITLEPNTGYDIGEVAAGTTVLANYTVDTDSDTDCANANGLPRGAATPTCTLVNTLKPKPQLKIEKVCAAKHAEGDLFQATNNDSPVGDALDCGDDTTITLEPSTGYFIEEVAAGTTDLDNYTAGFSAGCTNVDGLPRGAATPTCTITNTLKAAPQLTIEKVCPSGKHDPADRFQPTNGGSNAGSALDCDGSTTITLEPDTGYDIGEVAAGTTVLANYTVDTDSDTDCANANGLPRGAATPTCTITNTLKPKPQLTIEKVCPSGKHADGDRFQATNGGSNAGDELDCGDDTTITLEPDTAYDIGEVATGTTVLANYTVDTDSDADCADANGLPRGAATPICTITNTLRTFTVVTYICEGDELYASSVTFDGETKTSLAHNATLPSGVTEASLCSGITDGARFTGKKSGTKNGSVTITP